jgi:hypothetical protein
MYWLTSSGLVRSACLLRCVSVQLVSLIVSFCVPFCSRCMR